MWYYIETGYFSCGAFIEAMAGQSMTRVEVGTSARLLFKAEAMMAAQGLWKREERKDKSL